MKHCGTQVLETERLFLRKFTVEDAAAMYKNWASDEDAVRYLTWPAHTSEEISRGVLEDWVSSYAKDSFYNWAIVPRDAEEPVGSIGAVSIREDAATVEIGYCIGRKWWHRGIASEALRAVMDYLFENTDVSRIEARHDTRNPRSGSVMKKCSMKYEGTLRSADRNNSGICDVCCYSLLRSERHAQTEQSVSKPDGFRDRPLFEDVI